MTAAERPPDGVTRRPLEELLPGVIRVRDHESGGTLAALLGVIDEQLAIVDDDIRGLYRNWFIETCADWVVPYIGDLLGARPGAQPLETGMRGGAAGQARVAALVPRRDVANTIRHRRRKGTLALLEELAMDVASWPARAVEGYRLLLVTQHLDHLRLDRGRTVDMRAGDALDRLDGPFDELAHFAGMPRSTSARTRGRSGIPHVSLFVWRLLPHSLTQAPARNVDQARNRFAFDILGADTRLMIRPSPEPDPSHLAGELNVPAWIRRRAFEERTVDFYGPGRSLCIWRAVAKRASDAPVELVPLPVSQVVAADLSDWRYRPQAGYVAVDPELGRIAFAARPRLGDGIWVSYHRGFAADLGGGEYRRELRAVGSRASYTVGRGGRFGTIGEAYQRWVDERDGEPPVRDALIEILDDEEYVETVPIRLRAGDRLEIRAAQGRVPLVRLLDRHANRPDSWVIEGDRPESAEPDPEPDETPWPDDEDDGWAHATEDRTSYEDPPKRTGPGVPPKAGEAPPDVEGPDGCDEANSPPRLVLDGLVIAGRSVRIAGDIGLVVIRHSTLVPGWSVDPDCEPTDAEEPSLELSDLCGSVVIEHSIVGSIVVDRSEVTADPMAIAISDSIIDATRLELDAISGYGGRPAHARLTIRRSTVFGWVRAHAVELAEDSIFGSPVRTSRRQVGCIRHSYLAPGSRTPRRHRCQPDDVLAAVADAVRRGEMTTAEGDRSRQLKELRVRPRFNSVRYRTAEYAQLAEQCAREIAEGAADDSEMGAFHDLYQPYREANLRARLDEHTPASADAGTVFVT